MDRLIHTVKGLIPESRLLVKDIRGDTENSIDIGREWYLDGELVRRDAWSTILHPVEMGVIGRL
jgi:hypothetical protein